MEPIKLNLPTEPDAKILFNTLKRSRDPVDLRQGLLGVALPNGIVIDVSWYPEHDQEGAYTVTAFLQQWDRKVLEEEATTADEAAQLVENFVTLQSRLEAANEKEFVAELDRRVAEIHAGAVKPIPWSEIQFE